MLIGQNSPCAAQQRDVKQALCTGVRCRLNEAATGVGACGAEMRLPCGALAGLLLASCALCATSGASTTPYSRPAPSRDLPLDDQRLSRRSVSVHSPEQIHLEMAGLGAMAVSWVTHPEVCGGVWRSGRVAGLLAHVPGCAPGALVQGLQSVHVSTQWAQSLP